MAICCPSRLIRKRPAPTSLLAVIFAAIAISVTNTCADESAAESWRSEQLRIIAGKIRDAEADDERWEYVARQAWLRRWEPGRMTSAPACSKAKAKLVEEPLLSELSRPVEIAPDDWQQLTALQAALLEVDTDQDRKENLREIIAAAKQLEQRLANKFPAALQELPAPTAWVLAYTRYRHGRALAYRELPVVHERWPILNPVSYEQQLLAAYQRLLDQTKFVRPEFILLEDRILRRAGKKGRALELLEANQEWIEPKWYLKKRRDLLFELDWEPPYEEAARRYLNAGYDDD